MPAAPLTQPKFSPLGKALGGWSSGVLLVWSRHGKFLTNQRAADHGMTLVGAIQLLALDMYDHAYAMDFRAKAAAHVEGFMKGFSWRQANKIFASIRT
jgi:Fe-Mn family superoxide dismutase